MIIQKNFTNFFLLYLFHYIVLNSKINNVLLNNFKKKIVYNL